MPKISVVIPSFNRIALLPRALASIAAQTFRDFDVVIVNDGGDWPTSFTPQHCGVGVRTLQRHRGGPAAARNSGLAVSDSDYIAYLDDDDEWLPDHLETLLTIMEREPKSEMAFGIADVVDNGIHIRRWGDCRFDKFILDSFHTVFPLSACLHRRDLLRRSGVFDEHPLLIGPEDCEFTIRASDHVLPVPSRRCTVTMHRDHSMTRAPRKQWVDVLDHVIQKNGYGVTRNNWLMFYRALIAAVDEGRADFAERWADQLDRQLPPNLRRSGMAISGDIQILPKGIKSFCRCALES